MQKDRQLMINRVVSKMIFRLITLLWLPHPVYTQCSTGCASCHDDQAFQSICDLCDKGFWLNYPNCVPCPSNCETCTDDYSCLSCKPQFYSIGTQKTCQYICSSNCTALGCADETGYCDACPPGWYGSQCGEDCNLCRNGLCDLRKCSDRCKDRYVQHDVNPSNIYCRPCVKPNCMTCFNTTYCTQCDDGYYVRPYITSYGRGEADCQPCSSDHTCGNCDSILNCKTCGRDNGRIECSVCKEGYVLDKTHCVESNKLCPTMCNSCDSNGNCNYDCKEGYLGSNCTYRCPSTCKTCTNQISCDSCNDGFYTALCETACNPNCLGDTPVCRISDGYCLNGCREGFWGEQCQERCNDHCMQNNSIQVCWRNGTCTNGCYIGYSESDCSMAVSTKTTPSTTTTTTITPTDRLNSTSNYYSTSQSSHTTKHPSAISSPGMNTNLEQTDNKVPASAIGVGVGGGVAVVVVLVVIICYAKRRNRRRKENEIGVPFRNVELFNQAYDPDQQAATQPTDYIYAQPNKPKKTTQSKTYTSIEIDMNADKYAGEETDSEDTVKLEDLDDGEADIILAAVAPMSDTYYNTEGLVRSRIQVSKLIDYIHGKSDFQSEFERLPKILTRSCNEALKPENRAKNRYNGIYSYDATRVVLRSKEYINASNIEVRNVDI